MSFTQRTASIQWRILRSSTMSCGSRTLSVWRWGWPASQAAPVLIWACAHHAVKLLRDDADHLIHSYVQSHLESISKIRGRAPNKDEKEQIEITEKVVAVLKGGNDVRYGL